MSKKIIQGLIPPILFGFLISLRNKVLIFFGKKYNYRPEVFLHLDDIKVQFPGVWESDGWVEHAKETLQKNMSSEPDSHQKLLLLCIKTVHYWGPKKPLNIIDFGGGLGQVVPHVRQLSTRLRNKVSISVIDGAKSINAGKELLGESDDLQFIDQNDVSLSNVLKGAPDNTILFMSSVLQYVQDYKQFINFALIERKPRFICIAHHPRCEDSEADAFTIQDFIKDGNYFGSAVVNLFGKNSLVDLMEENGYDVFSEYCNYLCDTNYFGKCDNVQYKNINLSAYVFVKRKD
jgi:putative methyltransferase (TIGR04325 family)